MEDIFFSSPFTKIDHIVQHKVSIHLKGFKLLKECSVIIVELNKKPAKERSLKIFQIFRSWRTIYLNESKKKSKEKSESILRQIKTTTLYKNLWDEGKIVLRGKFILNAYIKKKIQIDNLTLYLKEFFKTTKPEVSRRKELVKMGRNKWNRD